MIAIRPIRPVGFDDGKVMPIKLHGEPQSVDTGKLMPRAYWFLPSTSIGLWGGWNSLGRPQGH